MNSYDLCSPLSSARWHVQDALIRIICVPPLALGGMFKMLSTTIELQVVAASQSHIVDQNGLQAKSGFEMWFAIRSQHDRAPNRIPCTKKMTPIVCMIVFSGDQSARGAPPP